MVPSRLGYVRFKIEREIKKFFEPLAILFRLFKIPQYRREYNELQLKFPIGARVVFTGEWPPKSKLIASPKVQASGIFLTKKPDEHGNAEVEPEGYQPGTPLHSFFVQRDIWVVTGYMDNQSSFVSTKVASGSSVRSCVYIKPHESVHIPWPKDCGDGMNVIIIPDCEDVKVML